MMQARELWQATITNSEVDRLLFWPKLGGVYPHWQDEPFNQMSVRDIYSWIGSDTHYSVPGCVSEKHRRCGLQIRKLNDSRHITYHTPVGDLTAVEQLDRASGSMHPIKFPVTNLTELKIMIAWYEDISVDLNPSALEEARAAQEMGGTSGMTMSSMGTTPLMHFVQRLAGVDVAQYLLIDHPDEVHELFSVMAKLLYRKCEISAEHNPADLLYLTENTSTTLISPKQFEEYCYPHIKAIGEMMKAADRHLVLHMCGHIKALLPALSELPVTGFEAFTSPPVGNTTLFDGRQACPNVCLIGGSNAALWTKPSDTIIAELKKDLDMLPHHRGLVISSAGVMPPSCKPETIKEVCSWLKSYPLRM
jgi:hypothetical protein